MGSTAKTAVKERGVPVKSAGHPIRKTAGIGKPGGKPPVRAFPARQARRAAEAGARLAQTQKAAKAARVTARQAAQAANRALRAVITAAKALAQAAENYTPVFEFYPAESPGRRTALAKCLTSRDNPLTARVAINHIWLRHFGKPFVRTVTNFGRNGAKPVNQPLLDWLAVELMENGWSMKHIHRLILTSSAYRMASTGPDTEHFTRVAPHRMEAEVLRDSVLYLAGVLDESESGSDIDENDALKSRRRSLYIRQSPETRAEFLKLFDQPDPTDCYVRTESVIPQQALAVANSSLSLDAARLLADRLGSKPDFISAAFETVTGVAPTADEVAESRRFLASLAPEKARVMFVHALLNHNEFVTIR